MERLRLRTLDLLTSQDSQSTPAAETAPSAGSRDTTRPVGFYERSISTEPPLRASILSQPARPSSVLERVFRQQNDIWKAARAECVRAGRHAHCTPDTATGRRRVRAYTCSRHRAGRPRR